MSEFLVGKHYRIIQNSMYYQTEREEYEETSIKHVKSIPNNWIDRACVKLEKIDTVTKNNSLYKFSKHLKT